jgi:cytochrome b
MTVAAMKEKILVWDAPVRVFHWLTVLCFAGAYLTAESERWRLVHVTLGYTLAGLMAFRVVWGLVGTRYARFSNFVRGPMAVVRYLRSLLQRQPEHHIGHNPAGALAILALLALGGLIGVTGWASFNEVGGEWLSELHELVANTMLALVGLHVAAVVVSSRLHGENLARAMVSGYKDGQAKDAARAAWWTVAAIIILAVAVFWWLQWKSVA